MAPMRLIGAVLSATTVAAHWPHPDMTPMVDACKDLDSLSNCTSVMKGVCQTTSDGQRSCGCDHHKKMAHGLMNKLVSLTEKMGFHTPDKHGEYHHHGWPVHAGDCETGAKKDGEECSLPRQGQCVSSGKCPMFKGEMVCYPIDAHPPSFVTASCKGKNEGDDCKQWLIPGKCSRPVPLADLFCKAQWGLHSSEEAKPEVVVV